MSGPAVRRWASGSPRGDDFPYYETRGFPAEFVKAETSLCARTWTATSCATAGPSRARMHVRQCPLRSVQSGQAILHTEKAASAANCTTELLASTTEADRQARTRNRCNGEGYESVGLFALRHGSHVYGLLQINDKSKDRFTPELIEYLEKTADQIAMALAQRQTNAELRTSEERYRLLADNAEDFVSLNDTKGHRLYISPSFYRVTGWNPEEDGTADWNARVHPDDLPVIGRAREANLAGEPTTIEHRIRCRNGSWLWVEARCNPVRGRDGNVQHLLLWSHYITARKRAEEALRESEAEFRGTFEMASIGMAQAIDTAARACA